MSDLTSGSAAGSSLDFQTPLEEPSTQLIFLMIKQGSLNATHFFKGKQYKCMVILRGIFPCSSALFGLVSYNDPFQRRMTTIV